MTMPRPSATSPIAGVLALRGGDVRTMTSPSQVEAALEDASRRVVLVVLYFTANGCSPCRRVAPMYEEMSRLEEFERVDFCKVNVSDSPEVAERYGVDGWPTFMLLRGVGEVMGSIVGGQAAEEGLYDLVAKHAQV